MLRSAVKEFRFFQKPLKVGQGARRGVKRRQKCLPLRGAKTKRPPVGKGFIGPRQSTFQHELAHRRMRYGRSSLQGTLRMAGKPQIKLLGTRGV